MEFYPAFRQKSKKKKLREGYTYLVSIFTFAIELEVLAHLSSEFVDIWSRWGEVSIEINVQVVFGVLN